MGKIPCFDIIKGNKRLEEHFKNVTENMPEDQQRDLMRELAFEYHGILAKDLNSVKKKIGVAVDKSYKPITTKRESAKILKEYQAKIDELEKAKVEIPKAVEQSLKETTKAETSSNTELEIETLKNKKLKIGDVKKGDTVIWKGKKYTVTSSKKDGTLTLKGLKHKSIVKDVLVTDKEFEGRVIKTSNNINETQNITPGVAGETVVTKQEGQSSPPVISKVTIGGKGIIYTKNNKGEWVSPKGNIASGAVLARIEKQESDKLKSKREATKQSNAIFHKVVVNIARRLGIPVKQYMKSLLIVNAKNSVEETVNGILNGTLYAGHFSNFEDSEKSEVLFQSEERLAEIKKIVPSLNEKSDKLLIDALAQSFEFNKMVSNSKGSVNTDLRKELNERQSELTELFKSKQGNSTRALELKDEVEEIKELLKETESVKTITKSEAIKILENELLDIKTKSLTDEYYLEDFSDKYIDSEIARAEENGNQAEADAWKYAKTNKEARLKEVQAQRQQQKEHLLKGINYLLGNKDYSVEFQYLMIKAALNYNVNNEGYLSKRTPNTVGLHTELSSAILPIVQEEMLNGDESNPVTIYNKHSSKDFLDINKRQEIAKKYVVEKRPNGFWLKFPKDSSDEVIMDLHLMAKETHRYKPKGSWCTGATFTTAKSHNSQGDFYIFVDSEYNTKLAMKYNGAELGESRGIGEGQLVAEDDLQEASYFYNKYPNAKKFIKTKDFNLLYNKYKDNNILEEKDIEKLLEVYDNGDGSYDSDNSDKKVVRLIHLLNLNKSKIAKHLGIEDNQLLIKREAYAVDIKGIKFLIGDLNLSSLTSADGLVLPTSIGGDLNLSSLTSVDGLVFPTSIGGYLHLYSLTSADGLVLPTSIGGDLNLYSLTSADGLVLPTSIGGSLNLSSLTSGSLLISNNTTINGKFVDIFNFHKEIGVSEKIKILSTNNQDIRGAIIKSKDKSAIVLGKLSDPTTKLHEIAHEFEKVLTSAEKAIIKNWAGTKEWTTKTSEAFAKGFEKFLYEGKVSDKSIQNVFEKFANYLNNLIKNAGAYFGDINELNTEMRDIYNQMVATNINNNSKNISKTTDTKIGEEQHNLGIYKDNEVALSAVEEAQKILDDLEFSIDETIAESKPLINEGKEIKFAISIILNRAISNALTFKEKAKVRALRSIKLLLPTLRKAGIGLYIHNSSESMIAAQKESGSLSRSAAIGFYDVESKQIHLNLDAIKPETPIHEVLHPIIASLAKDSPEIFKGFVSDVKNDIDLGKSIAEFVERNYPNEKVNDEIVVDFLAKKISEILGKSGKINDKENNIFKKIVQFIKNLIRDLGINTTVDIVGSVNDRTNIYKFAETLATAISKGNKIKIFNSKSEGLDYSIVIPDGSTRKVQSVNADVVNGFYSPLEKTINETKFDKLPAKQWADKFKSEEAKWTGLIDWIGTQQGSVSKADIQQYLKDNRIQVVEVVKGTKDPSSTEKTKAEKMEDIRNKLRSLGYDLDYEMGGEYALVEKGKTMEDYDEDSDTTLEELFDSAPQEVQDLASKHYEISEEGDDYGGGNTQYSGYQLPGEKSNYKEVLVLLPSKVAPVDNPSVVITKDFKAPNGNIHFKVTDKSTGKEYKHIGNEGSTTQSVRHQVLIKFDLQAQQRVGQDFKSSHFDEPNILVHLRMNTRTDAQGNKVLFLEEIQSDWGQKGKKEGFSEKAVTLTSENTKVELSPSGQSYRLMKDGLQYADMSKETGDGFSKQDLHSELIHLANKYGKNEEQRKTPIAPFVTDTNAWAKLGLKVALKEAVKQGVDKISWTTGEQQNERYNLSKQVDEISTKKHPDGTYTIIGYKDGNSAFEQNDVPENKLEEFVGKDLAKKISDKHNEEVSFRKGAIKEFQDFQNELQDSYGKAEVKVLESYLRHPNNENSAESKKYFTLMMDAKKEYEGANKYDEWNSFSGVDLKAGGKGMKGFYGSPTEGSLGIIGNVAKSLFKQEPKTTDILSDAGVVLKQNGKYDNGKFYIHFKGDDVKNNNGNIIYFDTEKEAAQYKKRLEKSSTQHSIGITPELKAQVEGGQPLFSKLDRVEVAIDKAASGLANLLKSGKLTKEQAIKLIETKFTSAGIEMSENDKITLSNKLNRVIGVKSDTNAELEEEYIKLNQAEAREIASNAGIKINNKYERSKVEEMIQKAIYFLDSNPDIRNSKLSAIVKKVEDGEGLNNLEHTALGITMYRTSKAIEDISNRIKNLEARDGDKSEIQGYVDIIEQLEENLRNYIDAFYTARSMAGSVLGLGSHLINTRSLFDPIQILNKFTKSIEGLSVPEKTTSKVKDLVDDIAKAIAEIEIKNKKILELEEIIASTSAVKAVKEGKDKSKGKRSDGVNRLKNLNKAGLLFSKDGDSKSKEISEEEKAEARRNAIRYVGLIAVGDIKDFNDINQLVDPINKMIDEANTDLDNKIKHTNAAEIVDVFAFTSKKDIISAKKELLKKRGFLVQESKRIKRLEDLLNGVVKGTDKTTTRSDITELIALIRKNSDRSHIDPKDAQILNDALGNINNLLNTRYNEESINNALSALREYNAERKSERITQRQQKQAEEKDALKEKLDYIIKELDDATKSEDPERINSIIRQVVTEYLPARMENNLSREIRAKYISIANIKKKISLLAETANNRSKEKKIIGGLSKEDILRNLYDAIFQMPKSLLLTADISGVGTNGLFGGLDLLSKDPKALKEAYFKALTAFGHGLKRSEQFAIDSYNEILSNGGDVYKNIFKLDLKQPFDPELSEEYFKSTIIHKIPVLRNLMQGSEAHMVTYLNALRFNIFDSFYKNNPNASEAELKNYANFVNNLTGTINSSTNNSSPFYRIAKDGFIAFKYMMSRLKYTASLPANLRHVDELVKKYNNKPHDASQAEKAASSLRMFGTIIAFMSLLSLIGDWDTDYTSKTFLKLRVGDKDFDFLSGLSPVIRTMLATWLYAKYKKGGEVPDNVEDSINASGAKGITGLGAPFVKYFTQRLNPVLGFSYSLIADEDAIGIPFPASESFKNGKIGLYAHKFYKNLSPLTVQYVINKLTNEDPDNNEDVTAEALAWIATPHGFSVVDYNDTSKLSEVSKIIKDSDSKLISYPKDKKSFVYGHDYAKFEYNQRLRNEVGKRILDDIDTGYTPEQWNEKIKLFLKEEKDGVESALREYYIKQSGEDYVKWLEDEASKKAEK